MATILAIDDEPAILELLKSILISRGHAVVTARNGRQGLDLARDIQPDLVITDLQMPELDGLAVVHELQSVPTLPIIVLSGGLAPFSTIAAAVAGKGRQVRTVAKPFRAEQLIEVVEDALASPRANLGTW